MLTKPTKPIRQISVVSKRSAPFRNQYASSRRPCCGPVLNCGSPQFCCWVCLFSTSGGLISLVFWIRHDKGDDSYEKALSRNGGSARSPEHRWLCAIYRQGKSSSPCRASRNQGLNAATSVGGDRLSWKGRSLSFWAKGHVAQPG